MRKMPNPNTPKNTHIKMEELLKIAACQTDIAWEDKAKNMAHAEELIQSLSYTPDMIIFPEMFLTGFSMRAAEIAEPMEGEMVSWMKRTAKSVNSIIIGSLPIVSEGKYFNRLLAVCPDGQVIYYDKRHLFRMGEESSFYSGGDKIVLFSHGDWNVKPLICYDLRFPIWSRNRSLEYNLLLYVANWPAARDDAFVSLLKARAIENQAYVIGVNRVGEDGNGVAHKGNSIVYDAMGKLMNEPVENQECVIRVSLSLDKLNQFRTKFPAYLDGDRFEILI